MTLQLILYSLHKNADSRRRVCNEIEDIASYVSGIIHNQLSSSALFRNIKIKQSMKQVDRAYGFCIIVYQSYMPGLVTESFALIRERNWLGMDKFVR